MIDRKLIINLENKLKQIKLAGLYKTELTLVSQQGREVNTIEKGRLLNFCSNDYLGLANNVKTKLYAKKAIEKFGFGLASVRFISGTQDIHKNLEKKISQFLKTPRTILYSSCFDANAGVFESLCDEQFVIISDSLNHASIIDGIKLSKAQKVIFPHSDMVELEKILVQTKTKLKLIVSDGVFSMDGQIAKLNIICKLADKYNSLVMIDDSHGIGVLGKNGRGSQEVENVLGQIDIISGTLGKALGGASGGFVSGKKAIIDLLRQKSRPYLFSNSLSPIIVYTSIKILEDKKLIKYQQKKLISNTRLLKRGLIEAGFNIETNDHPIVPIIIGEEKVTQKFAKQLINCGLLVVAFCFPVVPKGKARLRIQVSAYHTKKDINFAISQIGNTAKVLKII